MKPYSVRIIFCFPRILRKATDRRVFARLLLEKMQKNGSVEYAGYAKDEYLYRDLLRHVGKGVIAQSSGLSLPQKDHITNTIRATIEKCRKKLPLPATIFVFIFPYFPTEEDAFAGVMGFTPYSSVFHLFVSPQTFTQESLESTTAHELNHAIFYYYHYERFGKYTLLDDCIVEGLAENFREEVIGGEPALWSRALTKKEALRTLDSIRSLLRSKSSRIRHDILFGSKQYKRWTGYSVGYWLIKEFRKKHRKVSWEEIMQMNPESILIYSMRKTLTSASNAS